MGQPVIAWRLPAHYHRYNRTQARAMTNGPAADIERRLNDGAWLRPGEVGVLFGRTRWAVVGWLKNGIRIGGQRFYFGYHETTGGHRELDPKDVRAALDAYRAVRQRRTAEPTD